MDYVEGGDVIVLFSQDEKDLKREVTLRNHIVGNDLGDLTVSKNSVNLEK